MKKSLSIILSIIIVLSTLLVVPTVSGASTVNGYKYKKLSNGTAMITGYSGNATNIIIPEKLDGLKVTAIGASSFRGNHKITSVTIPNTVNTMGEKAFQFCSKLKSVSIGKGIKSLPKYAFGNCSSLKTFTIPAQVTRVELFALPYSIETLTVGAGLRSINRNSLSGGSRLKAFNVSKYNKYFKSVNGVLYNKAGTTLYIYPNGKVNTSFTVPSTVRSLSRESFYKQNYLEKINLNNRLISIYNSAFMFCKKLKAVNIPKSVDYIGSSAFSNCNNLSKITFADNKNRRIAGHAFSNTGITTLAVPRVSGASVFSGCEKLTSITIKSDVTTITNEEFKNCKNLKSVTVPKTVKKIGAYALGYNEFWEYKKVKGFTIKGAKGSVAEKYAKANGFKFVAV